MKNEEDMATLETVENDEEEGRDVVPPMKKVRSKQVSDVTGFASFTGAEFNMTGSRAKPRRYRAKSDAALMIALPEKTVEGRRAYHASIDSRDSIVKNSYMPTLHYDDLQLAEVVQELGSRRKRISSGISDMVVQEKLETIAETVAEFELNEEGLTSEEAASRLKIHGPNELPEKIDPKWLVFLRQFWAPMPIMIWLAIIIEIAISNYIDMGILLFIQFTNASISFYEINKAGNAVAALKSSLKPMATVKRDGKWQVMDATQIVPGDTVLLGSGSAVPADCRVNGGEIDVDQAALTGESLPVTFYKNDSAKMGSTVVRGEVEATVEFTGANTFFGKTASLLQGKPEHSHIQMILITIVAVLVVLSVVLCLINFTYLMLEGTPLHEALSFTVVLLVASIPLAIEIVTTTTLAIGSKNLAKHGAIVASLASIESLAGMCILCSDKTGTLTLNQMVLQDDTPTYHEGETLESILVLACLAAKWKEPPRDALDRLTLGSVKMDLLEPYTQIDYMPFDPTIKRTEGTVKDNRTGDVFKTTKGAPHIILGLLEDNEANAEVRDQVERDVARLGESGTRSLAVARTFPGSDSWKMIGLLTFLDPPRPDTKQTIADARSYGVQVKMITGDHMLIARNTSMALDMGDRIFGPEYLPTLDAETKAAPPNLTETHGDLCLVADGFAQVYPEHKYLIVECLRGLHLTVGMTGDGVNDAPALKRADCGIAVAGATDAARAAADIILTQEGLGTIIHGIIYAREIFQRINNFITYRIAATLQLLFFFFIATFAFHPSDFTQPENATNPWPEFFHMPVLMLMVITVLNDGTLITIAYDYAKANSTPDRWNLPALYMTSSVLGAVSCVSSLLLLWMLLDSWNPNGFFHRIGMKGIDYGQVISSIYLKVSVSDFLTLFSARTGSRFFWEVKPGPLLAAGGIFALTASSLISIFWPYSEPDDIEVEGLRSDMALFGFVWLFCIIFWFIQDLAKVLAYKWMYAVNFNHISSSGVVVLPDSAKELIAKLDNSIGDEIVHK